MYANRFDTDDVVFRIAKLAATGAIAGCAASASGVAGDFAVPFAACYLASRLLLLLLYLRAWRHVEEGRPTIQVYLVTVSVSAAIWAVSLAVPGNARYVLWAVAVLVDAVGPVVATLRHDRLPLHIEHLPERFALLVILVLGEAVGGAARGVHDASWAPTIGRHRRAGFRAWPPGCGGSTSTSPRAVAEREARRGRGGIRRRRDVATDQRHDLFVYGHLPVALGVVLAGVGLEELAVHPLDRAPSAAGWVLAAVWRSSWPVSP